MRKQIKWGEVDKEFIAHMEDRDRKQARAYQRSIELENNDNYSYLLCEEGYDYVKGAGWTKSLP